MRTQNSPSSPDDFFKELEASIERYKAKIDEFKDTNLYLAQYYEGRLDATTYLKQTFNIMFYDITKTESQDA